MLNTGRIHCYELRVCWTTRTQKLQRPSRGASHYYIHLSPAAVLAAVNRLLTPQRPKYSNRRALQNQRLAYHPLTAHHVFATGSPRGNHSPVSRLACISTFAAAHSTTVRPASSSAPASIPQSCVHTISLRPSHHFGLPQVDSGCSRDWHLHIRPRKSCPYRSHSCLAMDSKAA